MLNKKSFQTKIHNIGLYIRVSTLEQASNPEGSIKSQEQRLRQNIKLKNTEREFGKVSRLFIDRAKSGKDTNRPELQKLLRAIRNKEIDLVMVTELSRLSRSLKDFCEIFHMMNHYGCSFQSLREQYDTTTAAGEMILFTVANLAQFERRQTSERIAANFLARAERGLYNGGPIPFGYKLNPTKKGYLEVDNQTSETVKQAFLEFLSQGSLQATARELNRKGYSLKRQNKVGGKGYRVGQFTVGNLHDLLTRRAYLGQKVFRTHEGKEKIVKAVWPAIIDEKIFYEIQQVLRQNHRRLKTNNSKRYPFLLSRITSCGVCGDQLCGKTANGNGGKVAYYEHNWIMRKPTCLNKTIFKCDNHTRFQAKKLEPAVWSQIMNLIQSPSISKELILTAAQKYSNVSMTENAYQKLKSRLLGIDRQIEALALHLSKIPKNVDPQPIYDQMGKLGQLKESVKDELEKTQNTEKSQTVINLKAYQNFLTRLQPIISKEASHKTKMKIIEKLIHKIHLMPDGYKIDYHLSAENFEFFSLFQAEGKKIGLDAKPYGSITLTNGRG